MIAPDVVPVLYRIAGSTWPQVVRSTRRKYGLVGPKETVQETLSPQYKVLLRRYDLATLTTSWRLEAGGPVEFFDWDASGRVRGAYGIRYAFYSICPAFDEVEGWSGFGLNGRQSDRLDGAMSAISARLDCPEYIRSHHASDVVAGLESLRGRPRVEEARPGMAPTDGYFDVMQRENREAYLKNRGVNQYIGPGWSPETLVQTFRDPTVRAVWIADPDLPSATPVPSQH